MAKTIKITLTKILIFLALMLFLSPTVIAGDWPTRLYDNHRGGITAEQLTLPLSQQWVYTTARPPAPAWPESPAKRNFGAWPRSGGMYEKLKSRTNFDFSFDVAVVGDFVYFGSSRSGAVTCLNTTAGGSVVWTFFTAGPVRFAPTVANGKVYVGSDDGYAYCLNASDGSVVWKENVAVTQGKNPDMIWGNEHMISVWPVRSSILVDGGYAYWAAGLFPEEGVYLCRRNAVDGSGGYINSTSLEFPSQGYLLTTASHIYVTSNGYPTIHNKSSGSFVSYIVGTYHDGGCWAILTPDENYLWAGRAWRANDLNKLDTNRTYIKMSKDQEVASIPEGNYLIADGTYAYYTTDTTLVKILRSNVSTQWTKTYSYPDALIKAGTHVYAGGDGEIAAFDSSSGNRVWTVPVDGRTHGLAVAGGKLYASTENGSIYCFLSAP